MPWAPLLDAALVVVFAALGRASHAEDNALVGALATAWPFLVGLGAGWALVRWRSGRWPLTVGNGIPVWVCTLVVGMLLRAHMVPLELWSQLDDVQQARTLAQRRVQEVMISPVPTVSAQAPLRQVAQVLIDTDLPGLPVTDITGQLEGFISRTDILRALAVDPPLDIWSGPRPQLSAERRLQPR